MPDIVTPWRSVAAAFALNGVLLGCWASRVPAITAGFGLDEGALGLLLLVMGVGALVSFPIAGKLADRFGAVRVTRWIAAIYLVSIVSGRAGAGGARARAGAVPLRHVPRRHGRDDELMGRRGGTAHGAVGHVLLPRDVEPRRGTGSRGRLRGHEPRRTGLAAFRAGRGADGAAVRSVPADRLDLADRNGLRRRSGLRLPARRADLRRSHRARRGPRRRCRGRLERGLSRRRARRHRGPRRRWAMRSFRSPWSRCGSASTG